MADDDVLMRCATEAPMTEEEAKQFQDIVGNVGLYVIVRAAFEKASRMGIEIELNLSRKLRKKSHGNRRT